MLSGQQQQQKVPVGGTGYRVSGQQAQQYIPMQMLQYMQQQQQQQQQQQLQNQNMGYPGAVPMQQQGSMVYGEVPFNAPLMAPTMSNGPAMIPMPVNGNPMLPSQQFSPPPKIPVSTPATNSPHEVPLNMAPEAKSGNKATNTKHKNGMSPAYNPNIRSHMPAESPYRNSSFNYMQYSQQQPQQQPQTVPQPVPYPNYYPFDGQISYAAFMQNKGGIGPSMNSRNVSYSNTARQQVPLRQQSQPSAPVMQDVFPYPIRKYLSNMAILRVHELVTAVNLSAGQIDVLSYWQRKVKDFFAPYCVIHYLKRLKNDSKDYELSSFLLPIFFSTLRKLGVIRVEMITPQLRTQVLSNGTIFFHCPRVTYNCHYFDGSYVTYFSQLKGSFTPSFKIEWLDFSVHSFIPGIQWNSLEKLMSNSNEMFQYMHNSENGKTNGGREMANDNNNQSNAAMPSNLETLGSYFRVFKKLASTGIQTNMMNILQTTDVMSSLKKLMTYQRARGINSPIRALEVYCFGDEPQSKYNPDAVPYGNFLRNNDQGPLMYRRADADLTTANNFYMQKISNSSKPSPQHRPNNPSALGLHQMSRKRSRATDSSRSTATSGEMLSIDTTLEETASTKKRRPSGISPRSVQDNPLPDPQAQDN